MEYIGNICIFICLCDFISQLFISEKFKGIYKNLSGVFIILFLLYPLGMNMNDITSLKDGVLAERFLDNLENSRQVWEYDREQINRDSQKLLDSYINQIAEEVKRKEAKEAGK